MRPYSMGSRAIYTSATNNKMRGTGQSLNSTDAIQHKFRYNASENRRKIQQALTHMLTEDKRQSAAPGGDTRPDPFLNQFLNSSMVYEKKCRPKVLSLTSNNMRLGELTAANTKF